MRDCNKCTRQKSAACAVCGDNRSMYVSDEATSGLCRDEIDLLEGKLFSIVSSYANPNASVLEILRLVSNFAQSIANTWNKEKNNGG